MRAFDRRQLTNYLGTRTIVSAIMFVGQLIVAAMAKDGAASAPKIDDLNELMGSYKDLLLPGLAQEKDDKAKKLEKVFKEEIERGPFKVESMMTSKKRAKKQG